MGVSDVSAWKVDPASKELYDDFMIEPLGLQAGQRIEYVQPPSGDVGLLNGESLLLVGINGVTTEMERAASGAGASVRVAELVADMKAIDATMAGATLDAMYVSAGPPSSRGTLETDAEAWEQLFLNLK